MIAPMFEEPDENPIHVLPDVLEPGLKLVFCGTAAGSTSARVGQYYAGPRNKFWPTLHAVGLTPRRLRPEEFRTLPRYGLGLTDLAKYAFGSDGDLRSADYAAGAFEAKVLETAPEVLCFNGKKAAQTYLGTKRVVFGELTRRIGDTRLFVAPSTSGAASGHWDVAYWHRLAALSRTL